LEFHEGSDFVNKTNGVRQHGSIVIAEKHGTLNGTSIKILLYHMLLFHSLPFNIKTGSNLTYPEFFTHFLYNSENYYTINL
jgi:hypothetical protein